MYKRGHSVQVKYKYGLHCNVVKNFKNREKTKTFKDLHLSSTDKDPAKLLKTS